MKQYISYSNMHVISKSLFTLALVGICFCGNAHGIYERHISGLQSNSPTDNVMDIPLSMVFYNECCDEEVLLTGIGHLVENNNVHHVNVSGITGIGLSTGYEYVSLGTQVLNNVMYSNPVEGTLIARINMRNEDGCSFKVKIQFHLSVNANGVLVGEYMIIDTQCHG